jgi:hypothetical protein
MAEFCLKCFNHVNDIDLQDDQVELSEQLELCEGCGHYKIVVEKISNPCNLQSK